MGFGPWAGGSGRLAVGFGRRAITERHPSAAAGRFALTRLSSAARGSGPGPRGPRRPDRRQTVPRAGSVMASRRLALIVLLCTLGK